ncbi:isocitrate lyase/PEP mutase family protein, partial [Streptomyces sp. NPDC001348]
DIGFIAWPDMLAFVQRLRGAFPHHHLLVDIDDGYVDPEVACHVVEGLERIGASGVILEDQKRPRRCGHADGKQVLPLDEYLEKLEKVLATRQDLVVVARTDATDEHDILHRAERLAATDADVVLVDGVRSVAWIRRIREVVGDKPLLFNQIAGGKSPRLSLSELSDLGVDVAIYSTPCLFAAHAAMDSALAGLKAADGRLPEVDTAGGVGVEAATRLLERNIARHRPAPEGVGV